MNNDKLENFLSTSLVKSQEGFQDFLVVLSNIELNYKTLKMHLKKAGIQQQQEQQEKDPRDSNSTKHSSDQQEQQQQQDLEITDKMQLTKSAVNYTKPKIQKIEDFKQQSIIQEKTRSDFFTSICPEHKKNSSEDLQRLSLPYSQTLKQSIDFEKLFLTEQHLNSELFAADFQILFNMIKIKADDDKIGEEIITFLDKRAQDKAKDPLTKVIKNNEETTNNTNNNNNNNNNNENFPLLNNYQFHQQSSFSCGGGASSTSSSSSSLITNISSSSSTQCSSSNNNNNLMVTLKKFMQKVVDPDWILEESIQLRILLILTYDYYVDSLSLILYLIKVVIDCFWESQIEIEEKLKTQKILYQKKLSLKVVNILKYWIIQRPSEFQGDSLLRIILEAFIKYSSDNRTILQGILDYHLKKPLQQAQIQSISSKLVNNFNLLIQSHQSNNQTINILKSYSKDISEQLLLWGLEIQCSIQVQELLKLRWVGPKKQERSPNLLKFIAWTNLLSLWIKYQIVSQKTNKKVSELIKKFLEISQDSIKIKDYNTVHVIYEALNELTNNQTFSHSNNLTREQKSKIQELEKFIDKNNDYSLFEELLQQLEPPGILSIYHLIRKLSATEVMYTKVKNLINMKKFISIKKYLSWFINIQNSKTTGIQPNKKFQDYFLFGMEREMKFIGFDTDKFTNSSEILQLFIKRINT